MRRVMGFTLIELMITVAVVAILAAIALPSYREYVRKGRRAEALNAVGSIQMALERWRAENPTYAGCGTGCSGAGTSSYYTFAVSGETGTAYVITATPTGAQSGDTCGNLVANASDKKKPTWNTASCNN